MSDAIFTKVAELIAAHAKISPTDVHLESTFEELKVDSLAALSLIYDLEDEYGIEIPNEVAMNVRSVKEIVESLETLGVE